MLRGVVRGDFSKEAQVVSNLGWVSGRDLARGIFWELLCPFQTQQSITNPLSVS